jgi:LacI family transcriptional regulator
MNPERQTPQGQRFVAVLLPETQKLIAERSYYGVMVQGLSDGLMARGALMRPVQCLHDYQQEHFLNGPTGIYAGVVMLGTLYQSDAFVRAVLGRFPGPKVMLDHRMPGLAMHCVCEDSVAGMRLAAEHLLGLGHRRLAYLDMASASDNPWKREGLNAALRAAGLAELGRGWVAGCRNNFGDVAAALDWFLGLEPRPTAIVACGDVRALLMLQAAAERGLRIPTDLSLGGYGDLAVRTGQSRVLTSVAVDPEAMGRRAAELLIGKQGGGLVAALIPPRLVVRGTTGAPPG